MTFANPADEAHPMQGTDTTRIEQTWWPDIDVTAAQDIVRVPGNVTGARLTEALQAALWSVNRELAAWGLAQQVQHPDGLTDERHCGLYRRAVYFTAKAELAERYRDYDLTGAGQPAAQAQDSIADDARRTVRWAVSDLLGRPRVTVEAM